MKFRMKEFLSDSKKIFRQREKIGMGDLRYFATPKGLLSPEEIPDGWGLLEVWQSGHRGEYIRTIKEAEQKTSEKKAECIMLLSALRRLEISTAVYVVHE